MTSREMFEKFFVPTLPFPELERLEDGRYFDPEVENAWRAWEMSAMYRHEGELE